MGKSTAGGLQVPRTVLLGRPALPDTLLCADVLTWTSGRGRGSREPHSEGVCSVHSSLGQALGLAPWGQRGTPGPVEFWQSLAVSGERRGWHRAPDSPWLPPTQAPGPQPLALRLKGLWDFRAETQQFAAFVNLMSKASYSLERLSLSICFKNKTWEI